MSANIDTTETSTSKKSSGKLVLAIVAAALAFIGVLGVLLFVLFGLPYIRIKQDMKNLKLVALAMHNYESTFKRLPPATQFNVHGEKVWSWRVGLLPYLDDEDRKIFGRIDTIAMKPWNDPSNTALSGPAPKSMQSVRASNSNSNQANVFVVSAPWSTNGSQKRATLFLDKLGNSTYYPSFGDCADGLAETLMLIQFTKHSVDWASPTTLSPDEAYSLLQKEPSGCFIVMVDASIHWIPRSIAKEDFFALMTPHGDDRKLKAHVLNK